MKSALKRLLIIAVVIAGLLALSGCRAGEPSAKTPCETLVKAQGDAGRAGQVSALDRVLPKCDTLSELRAALITFPKLTDPSIDLKKLVMDRCKNSPQDAVRVSALCEGGLDH